MAFSKSAGPPPLHVLGSTKKTIDLKVLKRQQPNNSLLHGQFRISKSAGPSLRGVRGVLRIGEAGQQPGAWTGPKSSHLPARRAPLSADEPGSTHVESGYPHAAADDDPRPLTPEPQSPGPIRYEDSDSDSDSPIMSHRGRGSQDSDYCLFVSGIDPHVKSTAVSELFSKYGKVKTAEYVMYPHSRESHGTAFITMTTREQTDAAMKGLQGEMFGGSALRIEKAYHHQIERALFEQKNQKPLLMARQEQDSMARADGQLVLSGQVGMVATPNLTHQQIELIRRQPAMQSSAQMNGVPQFSPQRMAQSRQQMQQLKLDPSQYQTVLRAQMGAGMRNLAVTNQQQQNAPPTQPERKDYLMQLMLLEEQNKKRVMMARQEQESMAVHQQQQQQRSLTQEQQSERMQLLEEKVMPEGAQQSHPEPKLMIKYTISEDLTQGEEAVIRNRLCALKDRSAGYRFKDRRVNGRPGNGHAAPLDHEINLTYATSMKQLDQLSARLNVYKSSCKRFLSSPPIDPGVRANERKRLTELILTDVALKADEVEPGGDGILRERRKALVRDAQSQMNSLVREEPRKKHGPRRNFNLAREVQNTY